MENRQNSFCVDSDFDAMQYEFACNEICTSDIPEVNLWRAMIIRIALDAKSNKIKLKLDAKRWFNYFREDVSMSCDYANMPRELLMRIKI